MPSSFLFQEALQHTHLYGRKLVRFQPLVSIDLSSIGSVLICLQVLEPAAETDTSTEAVRAKQVRQMLIIVLMSVDQKLIEDSPKHKKFDEGLSKHADA